MATVVCNKDCKYRKAVFCGRDFAILNQFGMCDIWFDKNGQMRMVPNYPAEPQAASKQELPHEEKSEGSNTSGTKDENNENTET